METRKENLEAVCCFKIFILFCIGNIEVNILTRYRSHSSTFDCLSKVLVDVDKPSNKI